MIGEIVGGLIILWIVLGIRAAMKDKAQERKDRDEWKRLGL